MIIKSKDKHGNQIEFAPKARGARYTVNGLKKKGVTTVALCGSEGKVGELAEYVIRAQSDCTPFIQECHIVIGHALCAHVEQAMFPRQS